MLVIIGLIIGGVLVGRDLINAAAVRAQISQIEKFQTAVNTFRGKYGYLPGDIPDPAASQFGFATRGTVGGEGDGNGLLEGNQGAGGETIFGGETEMFWVDLSQAGMINGGFNQNYISGLPASVSLTQVGQFFPAAKLGRGNYIFAWSGGWRLWYSGDNSDGFNYFSISAVMGMAFEGTPATNTLLTVLDAYNIDKKVDDGLPQSGKVTAMYNGSISATDWSAGGNVDPINGQLNSGDSDSIAGGPVTVVGDIGDGMAAGPNSCYDGSSGLPEKYSMQINGGSGLNCSLSFQFQ